MSFVLFLKCSSMTSLLFPTILAPIATFSMSLELFLLMSLLRSFDLGELPEFIMVGGCIKVVTFELFDSDFESFAAFLPRVAL